MASDESETHWNIRSNTTNCRHAERGPSRHLNARDKHAEQPASECALISVKSAESIMSPTTKNNSKQVMVSAYADMARAAWAAIDARHEFGSGSGEYQKASGIVQEKKAAYLKAREEHHE